MKKVFITLFLILFSLFTVSAQEEFIESDETEVFDDFDSIFDEASDVDEAIVEEEEAKPSTPIQIIASAFSSMVRFSGNFTADASLVYAYVNETKFSGALTVKNTLYMTVTPVSSFNIRGSFYTGYDNGFSVTVPTFYFDYFLLNRLFISAGKKSIAWGYTRLFNDSTYYGCNKHSICLYSTGPLYTNIFADDTSLMCVEIRYPWTTGTLTFAATGNFNGDIRPEGFNYYGSLEFSVFNTSINLFGKKPAQPSKEVIPLLGGLEVKKTILGFDTYAQGICKVNNAKMMNKRAGYDYIVATAGFYRLFDSFDPNIGLNLEYQYEFSPNAEKKHIHRVAFEGGLKRLGSKKNMKIGVMSHFNFTELHGFSGLNFIVSGLFPYADWTTKAAIGYGEKYGTPVFMVSSGLALALDY